MVPFLLLLTTGLAISLVGVSWFIWHRLRHPPRKTYASAIARGLPGDPSELDKPRLYEAYELDLGEHARRAPVWSIDGDDPAGPVVIATPGWGDSRIGVLVRLGSSRAFGLAVAARRVIVWDPPGQGDAAGLCSLGVREPGMIGELIEHARASDPETPIVLFGSSLGAGASVVAASMHDEGRAVAGVIAEAPYRLPITPARNVIGLSGYPTFTLGVIYRLLACRLTGRPGLHWPRAHSGLPFDRAVHAAGLRCPLLVLHGTADAVSPPADGRDIAASAPESELCEISGAGHNDLWTNPAFAARSGEVCHAFIARVGGRSEHEGSRASAGGQPLGSAGSMEL